MKKFKFIFGILFLLMGTCVYGKGIDVFIDSKPIQMDVQPEVKYSSTYVPISFIGRELGAQVEWNSPNVIITKDDMTIKCTIGSNIITKNGKEMSIVAKPYISNGRTLVPLRFISEQLNCLVSYDQHSKSVYIERQNRSLNQNTSDDLTTDTIISNNDKDLVLSPNKLWGVKRTLVYSGTDDCYIIYLKDMTKNLSHELYATSAFCHAEWLQDNRLILSGMKDLLGGKERKHIMIYDPNTGEVQNIADADSFNYIKDLDAIIYFKRNATDDSDLIGSDCKIYYVSKGITETITQEQYSYYCTLL